MLRAYACFLEPIAELSLHPTGRLLQVERFMPGVEEPHAQSPSSASTSRSVRVCL